MCGVSSTQKALFLETTIQVERVIGTLERRQTIRHNIDGCSLCTSGHVLAEYNRTLIRDAITFRDILRTSPSVGEAVLRSTKYSRTRKFPRMISLLAHLGIDNNKQHTLERLEDFIEWRALDHFWESIDQECSVDEVRCAHREWQAEQQETGAYDIDGLRCLKASPPICGVADFIKINRTALEQFASAARSCSRSNVHEAAKLFDAILNGTESPFGMQNCYTISDTLIVLEAPSEAEVYSTDGDVHAICEILGKSQYTEVPAKP